MSPPMQWIGGRETRVMGLLAQVLGAFRKPPDWRLIDMILLLSPSATAFVIPCSQKVRMLAIWRFTKAARSSIALSPLVDAISYPFSKYFIAHVFDRYSQSFGSISFRVHAWAV